MRNMKRICEFSKSSAQVIEVLFPEPSSKTVRLGIVMRSLCMRGTRASHQIPEPTAEDLERIGAILRRVGGPNVSWGAQQSLDIWVIEQRARLDQQMSERIHAASWALVVATIGLVVCAAGLIWATLAA